MSSDQRTDVFNHNLSSALRGFGINNGCIANAAQNEREAEEEFGFHQL